MVTETAPVPSFCATIAASAPVTAPAATVMPVVAPLPKAAMAASPECVPVAVTWPGAVMLIAPAPPSLAKMPSLPPVTVLPVVMEMPPVVVRSAVTLMPV